MKAPDGTRSLSDRSAHVGRRSPVEPLSKLLADEEAAAIAASGGKTIGVFSDATDFSKLNEGRHKATRFDTFGTPTSLEKRSNTPHRLDRRWGLGDTKDLVDICEMGFAKSMKKLEKDILRETKDELVSAVDALRQETKQVIEAQEAKNAVAMTEILGKVESVLEEAQQVRRATAQFQLDLPHIREILERGDDAKAEVQNMESQLTSEVSTLLEEIKAIRRSQEKTEKEILPQMCEEARLAAQQSQDAIQRTEAELKNVASALEERLRDNSSEIVTCLENVREDHKRFQSELVPVFDAELTKHLQEKSVNVDFAMVIGKISTVDRHVSREFEDMLVEIAKIQQAMHLDFASIHRVVGEMSEAGRGKSMCDLQLSDAVVQPLAPVEGVAAVDVPNAVVEVKRRHRQTLAGSGALAAQQNAFTGKHRKRMREIFVQTDEIETQEVWTMTDPSLLKKGKAKAPPRSMGATAAPKVGETMMLKQVFANSEDMKAKVRAAAIRPQYNVFDYYWEEGHAQSIAKSKFFELATLAVIGFNTIWISIDTDYNTAPVLADAHPVFQVAENAFCVYFTVEIAVRFLAFKRKMDCLRDSWFVFDSVLVAMMILETWIITFIMVVANVRSSTGLGDVSIFRMVKLVKISRVSRLARLLRAIPELVIIIKGIGAASRSVVVFLVFWLIVIYVFALICRQLSDEDEIGQKYFRTVPDSMNTLLIDGILPDNAGIMYDVLQENPFLWIIMLSFILLASVTLMYMLVGVLVEVVCVIAGAEKEAMTVGAVASALREAMVHLGKDIDAELSKMEFERLLLEPEIARIISGVNVDVVVLIDMVDVIFEDIQNRGGRVTFETFIDIVLNTRGGNPATVKDVKGLLRVMKGLVRESEKNVRSALTASVKELQLSLQELKETAVLDEMEEDYDEHIEQAQPNA